MGEDRQHEDEDEDHENEVRIPYLCEWLRKGLGLQRCAKEEQRGEVERERVGSDAPDRRKEVAEADREHHGDGGEDHHGWYQCTRVLPQPDAAVLSILAAAIKCS